jgi:hypothetical protein
VRSRAGGAARDEKSSHARTKIPRYPSKSP